MNSRRLSVSDRARVAVVGLEIVLLMLFLPFVAYDITRMASYIIPVYNEGWNAYHTSRFLATGQLYAPLSPFPLTPVNYPPLSFLVIGGLSVLTGDLIMTGRLVALISYVTVGALVFLIVRELTSNGYAAGLAGTLWLAIVAKNAEGYVGVYEPQLLGHAFATGALYLYVRWAACLTPTRSAVLAVACCMAVFTKHLLIAVPLTLLMTMFFTNRKGLLPFILTRSVWGLWRFLGVGRFLETTFLRTC